MLKYRKAKATEYLAITGNGIEDIKVKKKSWIFFGQSCKSFDVTAQDYPFEINAISSDKKTFVLPAIFTIGPSVENSASLVKYAKFLITLDKEQKDLKDIIHGTIKVEAQRIASFISLESICNMDKKFGEELISKIQMELNQNGLRIFDSKFKEIESVYKHAKKNKGKNVSSSIKSANFALEQGESSENRNPVLEKAKDDYEVKVLEANAVFYRTKKEAEGMMEWVGPTKAMIEAFDGNYGPMIQYLMIGNGNLANNAVGGAESHM